MVSTAQPRGSERAWRTFVLLTAIVTALFAVHVSEEVVRGSLPLLEAIVVGTGVFLMLIIGAIAAWMRLAWGLGMAMAGHLWIAIAAGISHLMPANPDYFLNIQATWGGAMGVTMAGIAILVWLAALVGLVQGAWMVTRAERAPARRAASI